MARGAATAASPSARHATAAAAVASMVHPTAATITYTGTGSSVNLYELRHAHAGAGPHYGSN